ncbi:hypothetical protein [Bradyrhizobium japonicum]|uniref:hypothetical protein n=1 Tax=Bradyrhizobium japonicum TaxID=375 RepID=UPI0012FD4104|nr:hypothetical protein [Bradyrhizobium japonicum]UQD97194.1 hypothetical protein JEY30_37790 [Bradyrhizobium japonicum]WLB17305.1 hypothetical protein QIH95_35670 [Bradyrhizobium japonicum]
MIVTVSEGLVSSRVALGSEGVSKYGGKLGPTGNIVASWSDHLAARFDGAISLNAPWSLASGTPSMATTQLSSST